MRTLKENFFGNLGIGKKAAIEDWLKKYNIKNYTINPNLKIDVDRNVNLMFYKEEHLPDFIQFNLVGKDFDISFSNLTSLKGAPEKCPEFYCNRCKNLTSLEGAPKECKHFCCVTCKNLISLEGAPNKCERFYCYGCKGNFTEEDVRKVCNAEKIYCD